MSEHGGRLRESLPSTPRQAVMAVAIAFATALGGAIASLCSAWVGGIVTHGDLERELGKRDTAIGAITKARDEERAASRLQVLEAGDLERQRARALLVREIRVRVGLEAKVRVGMDDHLEKQAERTAAFVRAKYDDLILHQEEPESAADKALEAAQLMR